VGQAFPPIVSTVCFQSGSSRSSLSADGYRMRRAQNRRSQFPQRYCLTETNRNNLSSKSWRRDRLIRLLLQFGHVITRKRLYSLIEWAQISILVYRLITQKWRPQSRLSKKLRRWERAIIVLLQRGHLMMVIRRSSHSLAGSLRTLSCPSRNQVLRSSASTLSVHGSIRQNRPR
jgi:hypothetical protein